MMLRVVLLLVAGLAIFTACGGDDDNAKPGDGTTTAGASGSADGTATASDDEGSGNTGDDDGSGSTSDDDDSGSTGDDSGSGQATGDPHISPNAKATIVPLLLPEVEGDRVETGTGVSYIDIEIGTGSTPIPTDVVRVWDTGYHASDNTKFFSSVDRQRPSFYALGGITPGLRDGILGMKEGGKRRIFIPAELAFGEEGHQRYGIGPNEDVIYDVELIDVVER